MNRDRRWTYIYWFGWVWFALLLASLVSIIRLDDAPPRLAAGCFRTDAMLAAVDCGAETPFRAARMLFHNLFYTLPYVSIAWLTVPGALFAFLEDPLTKYDALALFATQLLTVGWVLLFPVQLARRTVRGVRRLLHARRAQA